MTFLIWAVITIAIFYYSWKGLELCLRENVALGLLVLLCACTFVGCILPLGIYVADRFFKRNLARKFMDWLHSMKPAGAWKRHLPQSTRAKIDNFEERYNQGSWKNRLHPRVAAVITHIEERWRADKF